MDPSVDPCEDFAQYSCGGWKEQNVLPEDRIQISTFSLLEERNMALLRKLVEGAYQPNPDLKDTRKQQLDKQMFDQVKTLYSSCMNESIIDSRGVQPLVDLVGQVRAEIFPITNSPGKLDPARMAHALAEVQFLGASPLLNVGVDPDLQKPSENVLSYSQSGLSLPGEKSYENPALVDMLVGVVAEYLNLTVPGGDMADWKARAKKVVELELALAAVFVPREIFRIPTNSYNPSVISELEPKNIDMTLFFSKIFPESTPSTRVIVATPSYFRNLSKIVQSTDPKVMEDYITWHLIRPLLAGMPLSVRKIKHKMDEAAGVRGSTDPPRWKLCMYFTELNLRDGLSNLYIKAAFGGSAKEDAEKTIRNVKDALSTRLESVDWMDKETSAIAVQKVKNLQPRIGYRDVILDPEWLANKYGSAKYVEGKFFENVRTGHRWNAEFVIEKFGKPVDQDAWSMAASTVNAYYSPPHNKIVFPAGVLQGMFYSPKAPKYLNYGAIGAVVGHEIVHAFDHIGRQYDKDGVLGDWWSNATAAKFVEKSQCFVEQYSKFSVRGANGEEAFVNGALTLGENIADNGGLSVARDAWLSEARAAGDPMLPGFDGFSQEQLFFLSFAQLWCSATRPEAAVRKVQTDEHSPGWVRINAAAANSPQFADAFGCKAGARMRPAARCKVW
ncbi:hypothetical protein DFJ73DRAFT_661052 [Zopfochytrium polystomum]|nr:hypothetical protein DFJ73DRAFT_661052 [Zopfochytrium polystomum]